MTDSPAQIDASYLPPSAPPANHGHTLAAWFTTIVVVIGSLVAGVAMCFAAVGIVWVGAAIVAPALLPDNPLNKIPTLVLDDGTVLYDSYVIIEYLDSLVGGRLIPKEGPARFTELRRHALEQRPQPVLAGTGLKVAALFCQISEFAAQAETDQITLDQVSGAMMGSDSVDAFGQGRRGIDAQACQLKSREHEGEE